MAEYRNDAVPRGFVQLPDFPTVRPCNESNWNNLKFFHVNPCKYYRPSEQCCEGMGNALRANSFLRHWLTTIPFGDAVLTYSKYSKENSDYSNLFRLWHLEKKPSMSDRCYYLLFRKCRLVTNSNIFSNQQPISNPFFNQKTLHIYKR